MGNKANKEKKEEDEEPEGTLGNNVISKSTVDLSTTEFPKRRKVLKIGNIGVSIVQGKITEEKADVIVNSVDHDLDLSKGRGAKAIVESGGNSIQTECETSYPQGISQDEVAVTGGGNLKCKKLYHITLPKWNGSNQQAVKTAVKNCLEKAGQNRITSLVFPPFGSGYLGYPDNVLSSAMLEGITEFNDRLTRSTSVNRVLIVCHRTQGQVFKAFERKAREMSGGGPHTVSNSYTCGNINITIQRGSLTNQKCDVMVVTASKDLKLNKGVVSKSVLSVAGQEIQSACENNYPDGIEYGEIASTRGYKLPCRFVYFVALPDWKSNSNTSEQTLAEVITNCLEKADSHDVKYMAFPTLGTGALNYPPQVLAKTMKECIEDFDNDNPFSKLRNIFIVVFDKGRDYLQIEQALQTEFGNSSGLHAQVPSAPPEPVEPSAPPMSPPPGTPQFHMWMYRHEDKPPSYWSIYGRDKTLKEWSLQQGNKKYELVNVSSATKRAVTKMVEETWLPRYIGKGRDAAGLEDLNYTKIKVIEVQRIENPELFQKYNDFRGTLFLKAGVLEETFDKLEEIPAGKKKHPIFTTGKADTNVLTDFFPEINEHYLFHGTREERIDIIATKGFDLNRADKAMFGNAIYAAESSTKSDQYADDKNARDKDSPKKIFLLRMALGEIYVTSKERRFSRPPCKTCVDDRCSDASHNPNGHGFFDSVVVDGDWNFREFLAFDSTQCYPEYVITYKRE